MTELSAVAVEVSEPSLGSVLACPNEICDT